MDLIYFMPMAFFWIILLISIFVKKEIGLYRKKSLSNWLLDILGMFTQGLIIPLFQIYIFYEIMSIYIPDLKNSIYINPYLLFLINFIVIDYIYYWNHRIMHSDLLWRWHLVHHTSDELEVSVTARNTIWSSFLICYLWVNSFIIYLTGSKVYIFAVMLTASLDLVRHSKIITSKKVLDFIECKLFMISSRNHSWHHSNEVKCNFGANFNLFDRIHGTYRHEEEYPKSYGVDSQLSFIQKLLYPFNKDKV